MLWKQNSIDNVLHWSGPVFCLLLGLSSDYAQPITGRVTEITCPMIGQAQTELPLSKRQKTCPGTITTYYLHIDSHTRSQWPPYLVDNFVPDPQPTKGDDVCWLPNICTDCMIHLRRVLNQADCTQHLSAMLPSPQPNLSLTEIVCFLDLKQNRYMWHLFGEKLGLSQQRGSTFRYGDSYHEDRPISLDSHFVIGITLLIKRYLSIETDIIYPGYEINLHPSKRIM